MNETVACKIQQPDIITVSYNRYAGCDTHRQQLQAMLAQAPGRPQGYTLVCDLSRIIDDLQFEDLMDLARFWASQYRHIKRFAAVVKLPSAWRPNKEAMHMYGSLMSGSANIGLFETVPEALDWARGQHGQHPVNGFTQ